MELAKSIVAVLVSFIANTFTEDCDDDKARDGALIPLRGLFVRHNLSVVSETPTKTKGGKAVAHNADDDTYLRVVAHGVDCPAVIKPMRAASKAFVGWVLVPDANRVTTHTQLESFCLALHSKAVKKHDDYVLLSVSATARQIGEDRANNTRQKLLRQAKQAEKDARKIAAFVALPLSVWEQTKAAMLQADDDDMTALVELVDDRRVS